MGNRIIIALGVLAATTLSAFAAEPAKMVDTKMDKVFATEKGMTLVAEMQATMLSLQLAHEALDRRRRRLDLAEIPDLSIPSAFGDRYCVLGFRHIDTDVKNVIFCHGPSFLCLGLGSALPSNPRLLTAAKTKGGPPLRPRS
jgi:hypothetical protein